MKIEVALVTCAKCPGQWWLIEDPGENTGKSLEVMVVISRAAKFHGEDSQVGMEHRARGGTQGFSTVHLPPSSLSHLLPLLPHTLVLSCGRSVELPVQGYSQCLHVTGRTTEMVTSPQLPTVPTTLPAVCVHDDISFQHESMSPGPGKGWGSQ